MPNPFANSREKRYEYFPTVEEGKHSLPPKMRDKFIDGGITEDTLAGLAVEEMVKEGPDSDRVVLNTELAHAKDSYLGLFWQVSFLREKLKTSEQMAGIGKLPSFAQDFLGEGYDQETLKEELTEAVNNLEVWKKGVIDLKASLEGEEIPEDVSRASRDTLYYFLRYGDAKRKERIWNGEQGKLDKIQGRINLHEDILGLKKTASDLRQMPEAVLRERFGDRADWVLLAESDEDLLTGDFFTQGRRLLAEKITKEEKGEKAVNSPEEQEALNKMVRVILTQSTLAIEKRMESLNDDRLVINQGLEGAKQDPKNSDVLELLGYKKQNELLESYYIKGLKFLKIGEIGDDYEAMREIINVRNSPIFRTLLYGPPGTGKTESLREIAREKGQNVRVISIHESSNFDSLVGMQQIPLPEERNFELAERFYGELTSGDEQKVVGMVSPELLGQFAGETTAEKIQGFKDWYGCRLKTQREITAIGAIAPEDPRVAEIRRKNLSAWIDQSLVVGLERGDIVVLDEIDKAGNALEGLQDILTRMPGETYHPAGRPDPFVIHPDARVVATSNWGDLQSEMTGGGSSSSIASAIANRLISIRKVSYAQPQTEIAIFNVMTSRPEKRKLAMENNSLLFEPEWKAVTALIEKVFPSLRENYLKGQSGIDWVNPVSIRTLENISRRIINPDTGTRRRDKNGHLIHLVQAAFEELSKGPFRENDEEEAKLTILRLMNDAGIFNCFKETVEAPRYLQVSFMGKVPPEKVLEFMGERVGDAIPVS
jgi:MoxR-like ATPase